MVAAGASTAALFTTGRLVGELAAALARPGRGTGAAWWWLVATATAFLLQPLAAAALSASAHSAASRYLVALFDGTAELGTHSRGLAAVEQPAIATRLRALHRVPRDWLFRTGIQATWTLLTIRLSGVGAALVVAGWAWWASLLLLVAWQVHAHVFARWSASLWDRLLDTTGDDQRRATYLRGLLLESKPAAEVRLFGLDGWIGQHHARAWQAAFAAVVRERGTALRVSLLTLLAPAAVTMVVLVLLADDAASGRMAAGTLLTMAQAVLAMAAFGPQNDPQVGLARTTVGVNELARLRTRLGLPALPSTPSAKADIHSTGQVRRPSVDRPAPPRPTPAGVRLTGVSFTYPGSSARTLDGLDLHIPAGQSVALVGLNGAGKTTLVRLLCGLYSPSNGRIRVDGLDPAADPAARRRIAVIFQQFVRYPLTLRDNVAAGAHGRADDPILERALHDAGAGALLGELSHGWRSVLSAQYDRGTDLSGGQWQRVALARALAALGAGAGLLVLDEPTSALDVRAEAALFGRFLAVARGATTLLVSHRLSSVRHAHRIVVLERGHIVEDGSHDDLLAAGGRYARLFTLQAARFARAERTR